MRYFQNKAGDVFGYDETQQEFIDDCLADKKTWNEITGAWPPPPPPPTAEETLFAFTSAIQKHLDDFARTRNYDNALSACTYAASQVTRFATEGQYMVVARDMVWTTAYQILADVESGARPMPSIEDVIAELPQLTWPS